MPMRPFDLYVHPDFKYQPFESYHGSTILAHSMPVLIIGGAAFTILGAALLTGALSPDLETIRSLVLWDSFKL